jgi:hypothetical protein
MIAKELTTTYIIVFNAMMSLIVIVLIEWFLFSMDPGTTLTIGTFWLFFVTITGQRLSVTYLNFPLIIFIFTSIVNCYYLIKIGKRKE